MEKQLFNISEEALEDLDQIFDSVLVSKIVLNAEEHHSKLKVHLKELKKEVEEQQTYLEKIDFLVAALGSFPKDLIDDLNDSENFLDRSGKVSVSSVLAGIGITSTNIESHTRLLEPIIGDFPMKDKDNNVIVKSLSELHLLHDKKEESRFLSIQDEFKNQSLDIERRLDLVHNNLELQLNLNKKNQCEIISSFEEIKWRTEEYHNKVLQEVIGIKDTVEKEISAQKNYLVGLEQSYQKKSKIFFGFSAIITAAVLCSILLQLLQ